MTNKRIPQPPSPIGYGEPREQTKITEDRKSTRLNSSHSQISYAVFCLKKKNNTLCILIIGKNAQQINQACLTTANMNTTISLNPVYDNNIGPCLMHKSNAPSKHNVSPC